MRELRYFFNIRFVDWHLLSFAIQISDFGVSKRLTQLAAAPRNARRKSTSSIPAAAASSSLGTSSRAWRLSLPLLASASRLLAISNVFESTRNSIDFTKG